jgi:hypothetical protein
MASAVKLFMAVIHFCAGSCGLYYKHITIVKYDSSIFNKLGAPLTDDARVIIYDRHMFIVQAIGMFNIANSFRTNLILTGKAGVNPSVAF